MFSGTRAKGRSMLMGASQKTPCREDSMSHRPFQSMEVRAASATVASVDIHCRWYWSSSRW